MSNSLDQTYLQTLFELKTKIQTSQIKAAMSVNTQMIFLYWEIGKTILDRQVMAGWGSKIVDTLSKDLSKSFPDMKGFSPRNLKHMRRFAETYPDLEIVKQVVSQIPWGHNIVLLNKLETIEKRLWYAEQTKINGWSRNILTIQIETNFYHQQA